MPDTNINEIIRNSLLGIQDFSGVDKTVGKPIVTDAGVTIIPISKISIGCATGGVDFGKRRVCAGQNLGAGGSSGISITPIAFLTVNNSSEVKIIPISRGTQSKIENISSLFERTPDFIKKIKETLS